MVVVNIFRATEASVNERIKEHWSAGLYHCQVIDSLVIDDIITSATDNSCNELGKIQAVDSCQ